MTTLDLRRAAARARVLSTVLSAALPNPLPLLLPLLLPAALALSLALAPAAWAAVTNIAQVPLLNISGTGTVKPNLMLLFDNSGSMEQHYTPDYVNDNLCRSGAKLSSGQMACNVGHPPFMSPDFNRQIYNPKIRYQPPIKADGTYYNEQTAANTANWTNVASDGFGVYNRNLYAASDASINLTTEFPDLKWCTVSGGTDCQTNTATYTYPDTTYRYPTQITTGPYYYTISTAEYCTNENMTVCKSTAAGAAAPSGYPVPAKVRWCSDTTLINCQAKRVGSYIYPRYSTASGATASYGTITIGASSSGSSLTITSVTIPDPTTVRTITNGTVTASTGTNSALKQQTLASALAASIIARTGLTNQYYACVKTPIGQPTVPACSTFGITLASDSVVAVVPVVCSGSKSTTSCLTVNDSSRSGWGITVNAPTVTVTPAVTRVSPTALITVSGTTSNSGTPRVASVTWGGATLATNVNLGNNRSASQVASTIVAAIGTGGTIKAYVGGNSVTSVCQAQSNTRICLVDTAINGNSNTPSTGTLTAGGSITFTYTAGSGYVAASSATTDSIPATTAALSNGSEAPSTFVRVNLTSGSTYPKGTDRVDCVAQAGVCTYAEEMTNFANWYTYYKSRLQMMKTAVGIAFAAINSNYRVGFVKLSNAGSGAAIDQKPADFVGTSRTNWYSALYNTTTSGSTPLRTAMDSVGKMFANQSPYNYAAGQEVVQYPCQPNFLILTTDGYWNGGASATVQNNDNVENASRFCTTARGCVDTRAQSSQSLADVALYWYNGGSNTGTVSLRPSLEPDMTKPGQVPAAAGENTHLHMNTYTLGLGMDGQMTYEPNYDTAPKVGGDFYNLITGVTTGCPWNGGGAYVWPDPQTSSTASTVQERLDDLWHAAINGHGKYFSANEPKEVVEGLSTALANMQVSVGAAAAAATSTPNISQQDNDIFSDTFTTVKWYGELTDRKIDPATGVVSTSVTWTSSDTVGKKALTDTRSIYMLDTASATPALKEFKYAGLSATEKAWFDNKCTLLSQCTLLSTADRAIVNDGANVVNWLRGVQTYANDEIFRAYTLTGYTPAGASGPIPIVLGDIASSKPAYLRDPRKSFTVAGYDQFKADYASRAATVFTAANDGMLHAFSAATGEEMWAYMPRITMKKLYALASTTYGTNHFFSTDGSPELGDVRLSSGWRTVLVAGLNGGGRGYYALDVTDPAAPKALWEICADPAVCANNDPDIGLTFGNAQYGMWQNKWVVLLTSGYNNVPGVDNVNTGNGQGWLYIVDVETGAILKKVSTGSGSTATPAGFAKITAITDDPATDPIITYVYGGDNDGKLWRFDLTSAAGAVSVLNLANSGSLQPITTRPEVTLCAATDSSGALFAQRVVLFGTGRLLDVPDTTNTDTQSLYLIRDKDTFVSIRSASEMVQQTISLQGSSSNVNTYAVSNNDVNLSTKSGWYFDWNLNPGERMNLDPKVVSGVANVVTNIPSSSSSCSVGGSSNVYSVNVCNGNAVTGTIAGGTLSNTSAAVGFIIIRLPKGELKMITTTAKGEMLTKPLTELNSAAAHRVGWRRIKND